MCGFAVQFLDFTVVFGFGLVTLGLCLGGSLRGLLIGSFRLVVCDLGLLGLDLERFGFDCSWLRVSWFDVGVV